MLARSLGAFVTLIILAGAMLVGLEALGMLFQPGTPDPDERAEAFLAQVVASLDPKEIPSESEDQLLRPVPAAESPQPPQAAVWVAEPASPPEQSPDPPPAVDLPAALPEPPPADVPASDAPASDARVVAELDIRTAEPAARPAPRVAAEPRLAAAEPVSAAAAAHPPRPCAGQCPARARAPRSAHHVSRSRPATGCPFLAWLDAALAVPVFVSG